MLKKISDKEYFAIDALSSSAIKQLLKTPAHFKCFSYGTEPTPSMRLGTLVHAFLLGGLENIEIFEDGKTLNSLKAEEFIKKHPHKTVVLQKEYDLARTIAEKQYHKSIIEWINQGQNEVTILVDIDGVAGKAKIDSLITEKKMIIDVKTTASIESFERKFWSYGYHYQNAWYTLLANINQTPVEDFIYWVIETSEPYESKCYRISEEALEFAADKIGQALRIYKECLKTDIWPGYDGSIETLELPRYLSWSKD